MSVERYSCMTEAKYKYLGCRWEPWGYFLTRNGVACVAEAFVKQWANSDTLDDHRDDDGLIYVLVKQESTGKIYRFKVEASVRVVVTSVLPARDQIQPGDKR